MQDLNYLVQKIQKDLLFSFILTVPWIVGVSEEGSFYKETFPPSFLALFRRPLWKELMALWDKPSSANNHRSKVKLSSGEWKPDKIHYKSWHSNWELSNANCTSMSGLPQCSTRGQILLSLVAWSILLILTGTSHLIKTSKIWSLKRLKVNAISAALEGEWWFWFHSKGMIFSSFRRQWHGCVCVCVWGQRFAGQKDLWTNTAHKENVLLRWNLPEHIMPSKMFYGYFCCLR